MGGRKSGRERRGRRHPIARTDFNLYNYQRIPSVVAASTDRRFPLLLSFFLFLLFFFS